MKKTITVKTVFYNTKDKLPPEGWLITDEGIELYYDEWGNWILEGDYDNPAKPPEMWAKVPRVE